MFCASVRVYYQEVIGNSLEVQWLGLGAFTAVDRALIPGRGTKILQIGQRGQKNKIK